MSNSELLQAHFHKQLERYSASNKNLQEFLADPDEQLAEATMEALRESIRRETVRANR